MIKKILFLLIFCVFVNAQKIQIMASSFEKNNNLLFLNNNVVVISDNYFAKAKRAIYNEESKVLELFEDVFINSQNANSISDYARVDLANKSTEFKNVFLSDLILELWLKSNHSCYTNNVLKVDNSILSSCEVDNPIWSFKFSSGEYNQESKDLSIKNVIFRIKNIPVFYFPYLRINMDNTRKSGFLTPKIAFKSNEAIFYEQPYFWAISHRQDLEFRPQIRTNRGYGLFFNYRLIDSEYSSFNLSSGFFKERQAYVFKEDLKYDSHFGVNLVYASDKIFNNFQDNQEGLYLNYLYLNDIDYLNLSSFYNKTSDSVVTSRLNYFYYQNNNYYGAYVKYYQDLSKEDQKDTIQELPNIHYHHFLTKFFSTPFLYKADFNSTYYYRQNDYTLNRFNINLPIFFQKSLFNNYLNLLLKEEVELNYNLSSNHKNNDFLSNFTHSASLYTSLYSKYNNYLHNINFAFNLYFKNGHNDTINPFYLVEQNEKLNYYFEFSELLYKNQAKLFKHFLKFYTQDSKLKFIGNEMNIYFNKHFSIFNSTLFNTDEEKIQNFFLQGSYNRKDYSINAGYFFNKKKDILQSNYELDKFLSFGVNYDINLYNSIHVNTWYNLKTKKLENYNLGFIHKRRCINFTIDFKESTSSKLTQKGVRSYKERGIYFSFNLYPIGGVKYNFTLQGNKDEYDYDF